MSLSYGPTAFDVKVTSSSQVSVTKWSGAPATLSEPVSVDSSGRVSFAVVSAGRYKVIITVGSVQITDTVDLTTEDYDTSDIRSVVDAKLSQSIAAAESARDEAQAAAAGITAAGYVTATTDADGNTSLYLNGVEL